MTTIWLLSVVYNLQKGLLHTICNVNNLTISHHMPCKNKLDISNWFCIFYVVWGFLAKDRSNLRTCNHNGDKKILLTILCKLDHNYSGGDRYPQSHLCKASCMSSVEQVSCARTCKVSPGRYIPLCHYDPKYTKNAIT
jgi:hypothetical protein